MSWPTRVCDGFTPYMLRQITKPGAFKKKPAMKLPPKSKKVSDTDVEEATSPAMKMILIMRREEQDNRLAQQVKAQFDREMKAEKMAFTNNAEMESTVKTEGKMKAETKVKVQKVKAEDIKIETNKPDAILVLDSDSENEDGDIKMQEGGKKKGKKVEILDLTGDGGDH